MSRICRTSVPCSPSGIRSTLAAIVACTLLLGWSSAPALAFDVDFRGAALKGGGNFLFNDFQFEGEKLLDGETHLGLAAGVSTEWRLQRRSPWKLVLEGWYLQKGYRGGRTLTEDPAGLEVEVDADYLSFPVMLRVNFAEDDLTTYAVFGPSLELLMSHDDDAFLDEFRSWSLAGGVGLGAELQFAERMAALVEFRFSADFTDNWEGPDEVGLSSARHRLLLVTAGLRF